MIDLPDPLGDQRDVYGGCGWGRDGVEGLTKRHGI